MTKQLRGLLIVPLVVLAVVGWDKAYAVARKTILGGGVNVQSLHTWWSVVGAFCVLMFAITAGLVILFLRLSGRQVDKLLIAICVENAMVIWLLFALAAITSDSAAIGHLAQIGLAGLGGWLFHLGLLWCLVLLYLIFKTVDSVPRKAQ